MFNELAHFSLNIALGFAVLGTIIPLLGATLRRSSWMQLASVFALLQFLLVAFAFGVLTRAFVTSDFSLRLVVLNSHTLKPMIYKIAGVWGNHEGSLLLWVLILTFFLLGICLFFHFSSLVIPIHQTYELLSLRDEPCHNLNLL